MWLFIAIYERFIENHYTWFDTAIALTVWFIADIPKWYSACIFIFLRLSFCDTRICIKICFLIDFCFNGNSYDMELLDYFTDKQSSAAEGASRAPWLMFIQRRSKTERNDTSATHTLHWIKLHNKSSFKKSTDFGNKRVTLYIYLT